MKPKKIIQTMVIIAFVALITGGPVQAETGTDKTLSPYFFVQDEEAGEENFPLKSTDVSVDICGVIADVTVNQLYENRGSHPLNARYIFPASTRAAVHGLTMKIGERVIQARIKEKQEAKKTFETAKKQGKSATLLEQQRPNVFDMNVANILPGDVIQIELRYTELLVPVDGIYEFVYPTVVGPRYSNQKEETAPESEKWIKNPYLKTGSSVSSAFNIGLNLSAGLPIQDVRCRSHETVIDWDGSAQAHIRLADAGDFGGDRDYILHFRLAGEQIESGLMLYQGEEENFFLLMAQPPERIRPEDIPAREYIFVVDVSGSMYGFPLNTAKKLMKDLVGGLGPEDVFNVVLFAGGSRLMADASLPATPDNIRRATALLDGERGGGGTELHQALTRALGLPRTEGRSRSMVIVTDGYIDAEGDVFELIRDNLNRTNVFAFGIGSSVNRYLIEGMAGAGQGEPFVVTDAGQTGKTAAAFRDYISAPVLTGTNVRFEGFDVYDVEPPAIPDLFARRPVIVFGKWRGEERGTVTLTGTGGQGTYRRVFDVAEIKPQNNHRALRYLWARARIARLSDFSTGQPDLDRKTEITNLGLTYNLLTRYTSFIAVLEEIRNPDGAAREVRQPLPLPKGVSNLAVGGGCVTVPEPGMIYLIPGLLAMVLFLSVRRRVRETRAGSRITRSRPPGDMAVSV